MRTKLPGAALLIIALLFLMSVCAAALENGQYVVSNTTYYVNPNTGVSEDGGDTSIGESMARNAVKEVTLYEKSAEGQFVTLRLGQSSFIKNIAVLADGRAVSYEVTGKNESDNTVDLRFAVSSENPLIQPSFFVVPMNRDVTFYVKIDTSSAKKDAASLARFGIEAKEVEPPAPKAPAQPVSEPEKEETPAVTAAPTTAPDSAGVSPAPNEEPKNAVIEEQPEESAKPEESTEPEQSAVTEQSEEIQGIVEFPADAPPETEEESGRSSVIWAVVAVDVILLILIGGYFWRKKVLK